MDTSFPRAAGWQWALNPATRDFSYQLRISMFEMVDPSHGMILMAWVRSVLCPKQPTTQTTCRGYQLGVDVDLILYLHDYGGALIATPAMRAIADYRNLTDNGLYTRCAWNASGSKAVGGRS